MINYEELIKYKTPLYVFNIKTLVDRINYLKSKIDAELVYAVKANTFIAKEIEQEVSRFEICSYGEYEICDYILQHRKYSKLKSTYTDSLPALISKRDGRIHTTYNQALTVTGRLSSSNPNLQNIPIRTEEGNKIRAAFCAEDRENSLILSADAA